MYAGFALRIPGLLLLVCVSAFGQEDSGYRSLAPFPTPEAAEGEAVALGLGRAEVIGKREFAVNTYDTVRVRYVVGAAGLATGARVRVSTAHDFRWDMWGGFFAQDAEPAAENFISWRASNGAQVAFKNWATARPNPFFASYHPWQNVLEFTVQGTALEEGDSLEIVFGDRTGGSPGVRMQPMDEEAFEQKFFVDHDNDGVFLPLAESPVMRIVAGAARKLHVYAPSDWVAGEPGWLNVWAEDGLGNPAVSYRAEIVLGGPAGATVPAAFSLSAADRGARRLDGVVLPRAGTYRFDVRDRAGELTAVSNPVTVHDAAPELELYWGDVHTHTKYSDGRGLPEELYDFAYRVTALDFAAVSDHAFTTTDGMWEQIKAAGNRWNEPGRFVTLLGYEWSGRSDVGGDHNVYTPEDDMPLIRSMNSYDYENLRMTHDWSGPNYAINHVEVMFRKLDELFADEQVLTIPHYGGRPGNPKWHNPKIQRGIEAVSDHRRSEDWASTFLERGYRVGIIGATDNHNGNAGYGARRIDREVGEEGEVFSRFSPTEFGTALMGVYAEGLTREEIFQAIYHRRTYATTGSRIRLAFAVNGAVMGSEIRVSGAPRITASAAGTAGIAKMRIVKNGAVVYSVEPGAESAELEYLDREGVGAGAYYYLDLVQEDGEKAISSPVWVDR